MMVDFEFPKQTKAMGVQDVADAELLKKDLTKLEDIQKLTNEEIKSTKKALKFEEDQK